MVPQTLKNPGNNPSDFRHRIPRGTLNFTKKTTRDYQFQNYRLGSRDSNPDSTVQSRMSCRWTTSQKLNFRGTNILRKLEKVKVKLAQIQLDSTRL